MARIVFTRDLHIKDDPKNILLIIDPQVDFHGDTLTLETGKGSLAVVGADKDARVLANFIKNNLCNIDEVFVTLDSHHTKHIAHQAFWTKAPGNTQKDDTIPIFSSCTHVPDYNDALYIIDSEKGPNMEKGWTPKDVSLKNWSIDYSKKLEKGANQFKLCIWPDHCLIGTLGHTIEPNIQAALSEWNLHPNNLSKKIKYITKGMNCLTEMYRYSVV